MLADAVYEGDMGKLQLLTTCGFDVKEKYTHPEVNGGSPVTLKDIVTAKHRDKKGEEINTMLNRIEGGGRLFTRDNDILTFIRTWGCVEIEAALIEGGMPRDAKSVQEALLAAASQGKGGQLKKTFAAWSQDTNFVLADAVYEGDVGKLPLLTTCGFDVKEKYTHPEVHGGSPVTLKDIVTAKHRDKKGEEINTILKRIENKEKTFHEGQ